MEPNSHLFLLLSTLELTLTEIRTITPVLMPRHLPAVQLARLALVWGSTSLHGLVAMLVAVKGLFKTAR